MVECQRVCVIFPDVGVWLSLMATPLSWGDEAMFSVRAGWLAWLDLSETRGASLAGVVGGDAVSVPEGPLPWCLSPAASG